MKFDHFSIALLSLNPDGPKLTDAERTAIQDAHLDHLATLHEAGHLLAAGPLAANDPGEPLCGLSILTLPVDEARALKEADPAVQAGVFLVKVVPWQVPGGAVTYARTRFPHSVAEVLGD